MAEVRWQDGRSNSRVAEMCGVKGLSVIKVEVETTEMAEMVWI